MRVLNSGYLSDFFEKKINLFDGGAIKTRWVVEKLNYLEQFDYESIVGSNLNSVEAV